MPVFGFSADCGWVVDVEESPAGLPVGSPPKLVADSAGKSAGESLGVCVHAVSETALITAKKTQLRNSSVPIELIAERG